MVEGSLMRRLGADSRMAQKHEKGTLRQVARAPSLVSLPAGILHVRELNAEVQTEHIAKHESYQPHAEDR